VEDISLPMVPLSGAVFMALCDSEAAGYHMRWLSKRAEEYDQGTRRRLVTAGLIPAAAVHQAARARALIRNQLLEALAKFDLLLAPTSPHPAPAIASHTAPVTSKEQAGARFFGRRSYTTPASLAGVPAIRCPRLHAGGLPIGLHYQPAVRGTPSSAPPAPGKRRRPLDSPPADPLRVSRHGVRRKSCAGSGPEYEPGPPRPWRRCPSRPRGEIRGLTWAVLGRARDEGTHALRLGRGDRSYGRPPS
jgi:hypothetical protein